MAVFEPVITKNGQHTYDNFHFSEAVEIEGLLICSGVIGTDGEGRVPGDVKEEFRNAWKSIGELLEKAGLKYENIIEYTSYHVGLQKHMGKFMSVRNEFLSEPWPAWTAVGITELAIAGVSVEIKVIAKRG